MELDQHFVNTNIIGKNPRISKKTMRFVFALVLSIFSKLFVDIFNDRFTYFYLTVSFFTITMKCLFLSQFGLFVLMIRDRLKLLNNYLDANENQLGSR